MKISWFSDIMQSEEPKALEPVLDATSLKPQLIHKRYWKSQCKALFFYQFFLKKKFFNLCLLYSIKSKRGKDGRESFSVF